MSLEVDREFFEANAKNPEAAWANWREWLVKPRKRTDDARLRRILELATELSPSAISHYTNSRRARLGAESLAVLDRIALLLGRADVVDRREDRPRVPGADEAPQIALFTELDVPSRSFHARIITTLVREVALDGAVLSIFETSAKRLDHTVARVLETQVPHAVLLVRLTPPPQILDRLRGRGVSVIVIHGDHLEYPAPVVASVIPGHEGLGADFDEWARSRKPRLRRPLLVTLPDEPADDVPHDWVPTDGNDAPVERNLRRDRRQRIADLLRETCKLKPDHIVTVADFSYIRAFEILERFPDRDLYVVLSDEVALALRAVLDLTGVEPRPVVVGYDFTPEAQKRGLPSFDQGLDLVAGAAMKALGELWRRGSAAKWPNLCEIVRHKVVFQAGRGY